MMNFQYGKSMRKTIETKRLILRPFVISDAQKVYDNWTSDEEVSKYVTWNAHQSIEDTKAYLTSVINDYSKEERICFGIVFKEDNELIGAIDVCGYLDGIPVIGYCLSRKYWNQGIMSEANQTLIDFLFTLGHKKIIIDALIENIGSNRVIQKCGGIFEKTYEEFIPNKNKIVQINRYIINK